jgi:secreted trypsin-like serine protease
VRLSVEAVIRTRRFAVLAAALTLVPVASATAADKAPLIVGGTAAAAGAWPSIALLEGRFNDGSGGQDHVFHCTGSVVAPQWIVTAGHCAFGNPGQPPNSMNAILGVTDYADSARQVVAVDRFVPDPAFDPGREVNDVALLHLQQPTSVPAMRIATSDESAAGRYVSDPGVPNAAGWGATDEAGTQFTTVLQEAYLEIRSAADCGALIPSFDSGTQACAGTAGRTTACFGDSGGPLVMFDATTHEPVLWGVTSYRPEPDGNTAACSLAVPTVFSWLPAFADFTNSTIAGASTAAADLAPAPASDRSQDAGRENSSEPAPRAPVERPARCRRARTALAAARKREDTLLRRLHAASHHHASRARRQRASRRYHAAHSRRAHAAALVRQACTRTA